MKKKLMRIASELTDMAEDIQEELGDNEKESNQGGGHTRKQPIEQLEGDDNIIKIVQEIAERMEHTRDIHDGPIDEDMTKIKDV